MGILNTMGFAGIAVSLGLGCLGVSPQQDEPAVQGDYQDGDTEHRPGQPCLLCHGGKHFPFPPGEVIFTVAGTVYGFVDDEEDSGLQGVDVSITDANEQTVLVTTNRVGNFMISEGSQRHRNGWLRIPQALQFPLEVKISQDGVTVDMKTRIQQEGSCARCHGPKPGADSVGRVFLFEDEQ